MQQYQEVPHIKSNSRKYIERKNTMTNCITDHLQRERTKRSHKTTKKHSTWGGYYSSPDNKNITTRDTEIFARYV